MTGHAGPTPNKRTLERRRTLPWAIAALVAVAFAGAGLIAFALFASDPEEAVPGGRAEVPETARDPQVVAGLEVLAPWADHGEVPLDTPVGHEWLLRNTGPAAISLGSARIETLEGC